MNVQVSSKREFQQLLREDFIPYMNNIGMGDFIRTNQREMFTTWTTYFYPNKSVELVNKLSN
jgi:hypothetical protein